MPAERRPEALEIPLRRSRALRRPTLIGAATSATLLLALLGSSPSIWAYDVNEWLSVGGILATGAQCQFPTDDSGGGDKCRGALPIQAEMSLRPGDSDEFFVKLGLAAGDGLNDTSPFATSPWATDLHQDVESIRWNHLLNAWYGHRFTLGDHTSLRVTGGVIDATDYLDDNAYSNDEYSQFMNQALVNAPNSFMPSYEPGAAVELDVGSWSVRGVVMRVDENDDGNSFTFWGTQLGYTTETSWGEGTYRVLFLNSTDDFLDPTGTREESRLAVGISFDQKLGETFGAFLRFAWQDDDAAITYDSIYSGGINVRGGVWGRSDDEIGLAYGFLDGGNQDLRRTHLAEVYYRLAISEHFALTADAQYIRDTAKSADGADGFVLGLRFTVEF